MNEQELIEKLRLIEALFAGAEVVKEQMMIPSVSGETVSEIGSQAASTDWMPGAGSAAGDPVKSKRRKNRSKAKRKKRKKRRR
jgi:hypothetical protein